MFSRGIIARISKVNVARALPLQRPVASPAVSAFVRYNSSASKDPQALVGDIMKALSSNPQLAQKAQELQGIFKSMGIEEGKPPSVVTLMKVLANKEVRSAMSDLRDELEKAGVNFSGQDAKALMKMWGLEK